MPTADIKRDSYTHNWKLLIYEILENTDMKIGINKYVKETLYVKIKDYRKTFMSMEH